LDASQLPPIYEAGIKYSARDPEERWQLPSETFARRRGDCEDLAVWRAAELRVRGEHARVVVRRTGPRVLHAIVVRGDGSIEDPSRRLGMR
jgi:transglutaminase-like putative cysteine protease